MRRIQLGWSGRDGVLLAGFKKETSAHFSSSKWWKVSHVLGSYVFYGVGSLVVTSGRQNAESYCNTLQNNLLSFVAETFGEQKTWVFQQDNAPIYTARLTRSWLNTHQVRTLPWPARCPDLNIIENVWGELVRHVYKRGRRFQTLDELEANIREAWASISTDYLFKLYRSMSRRLIQVIEQKGAETRY